MAASKLRVPGTQDEFITAIPWGGWVCVLVHRRRHNGKNYIRFRRWNKHRTKGCWYPTTRFFVIPEWIGGEFIEALEMVDAGAVSKKPEWLLAWEDGEDLALRRMEESGASEEAVAETKKRIKKDRRGRI